MKARAFGGGIVVAYVAMRAWRVPLTYDEAASLERYATGSWLAVLDFSTAANHFLFTVLMRAAVAVGGTAEWVIRLPSLVAAVGFVTAAAALAQRMASPRLRWPAFILLVCNAYLLEYFALARGYGLALTLELVALVAWLDRVGPPESQRRSLGVGVAAAVGAVLVNYGFLVFWVAYVCVVAAHAVSLGGPASGAGPRLPWRAFASALVMTMLFNAGVVATQRGPLTGPYTPFEVRLVGLLPEEQRLVEVFWTDATGRPRPLQPEVPGRFVARRTAATWTRLRVVLPEHVDRNVGAIEIHASGARTVRTPESPGPWAVLDRGGTRLLISDPWVAEGLVPGVWRRAFAVGIGVTVALALSGLGGWWSLMWCRRGWDESLPILWLSGIVVAGLTALPVWLLSQRNELFFGGHTGLVVDTAGSVGQMVAGETTWSPALARHVVLAAVIAAFAAAVAGWRRRHLVPVARALGLAGIAGVAVVVVAVQGYVLGAPFPVERTALFLLPLLTALCVCALDATMLFAGPVLRRILLATAVAAAVSALWHNVTSANFRATTDWSADAVVPDAIRSTIGASPGERMLVDWQHYPVAHYYAARAGRGLDVVALPGDGVAFDYVLGARDGTIRNAHVLRDYPEAGLRLWRVMPGE